jgi:hypothetical protein
VDAGDVAPLEADEVRRFVPVDVFAVQVDGAGRGSLRFEVGDGVAGGVSEGRRPIQEP